MPTSWMRWGVAALVLVLARGALAEPPAPPAPAAPTPMAAVPAAATASASTSTANARTLLKAFFAETDAAHRADLARQFAAVAPKSWADLRTLLHETAARPALAAGTYRFEIKSNGVLPDLKYVLRVPAGYAADAPRGWPLLVICHPTGGNADLAVKIAEEWLGPDVEKCLVAAPDAPTPGSFVSNR